MSTHNQLTKRAPRELLSHERQLYLCGALREVTHENSLYLWFQSDLGECDSQRTLVYRHMGDVELTHLVQHGTLPDTQPYQTIVQGKSGYEYCTKYLYGTKRVDTNVTTVIEFCAINSLIDEIFAKFHKPEDGCLSTGLGDKAGNTLMLFNQALADSSISWRPVLVKRMRRRKRTR